MHYDIKLYYFAATELLKYANPKISFAGVRVSVCIKPGVRVRIR